MTDPDSIVQSIKTFLETDTGDDTQKNELKQKLGELIPNVEQACSSGIKQITDTLYKLKLSQASKIPRYKLPKILRKVSRIYIPIKSNRSESLLILLATFR